MLFSLYMESCITIPYGKGKKGKAIPVTGEGP
jgi:hypothetical protein